jgi:diacylglycerol O-acyltransferase
MASFASAAARMGAQYSSPCLSLALAATVASTTDASSLSSSTTFCEQTAAAPSASAAAAKSKSNIKTPPPKIPAVNLKSRVTMVGRFSLLSETLENPSIPCMVLALSGKPLYPKDFTRLYQDRGIAERHPRFSSVLDASHQNFHFVHQDHFQPHVTETLFPLGYRMELKDLIDDAITQPWDLTKQGLWQVRTSTGGTIGQSGVVPSLLEQQQYQHQHHTKHESKDAVESLIFFRSHHCMADGVSLGAIFRDLMDEGPEFQLRIDQMLAQYKKNNKKKSWWRRFQIIVGYWGWGSLKAFFYQLYLYASNMTQSLPWSWSSSSSSNPWKVLQRVYEQTKDHNTQAYRKRTLSWCQVATVDQVKQVAEHFSSPNHKVTVNDVFASCVSAAIARLLQYHRQTMHAHLPVLPKMNLVIPVHLQGGILLPGQSLGNKIGAMICRIPAETTTTDTTTGSSSSMSSGDRLRQVNTLLQARKDTPAAFLSFMVARTFGALGNLGGLTPWLFSQAHANASAVLTNVKGSDQWMHLEGRRVEAILGFLPLPPGIPVGVVCNSYAGQVGLTVTAEPWAVPDADLFLTWVVEEYQSLLQEANKNRGKEKGNGKGNGKGEETTK